jgi:hypothetical protein
MIKIKAGARFRGFVLDREWLLTASQGRFREFPHSRGWYDSALGFSRLDSASSGIAQDSSGAFPHSGWKILLASSSCSPWTHKADRELC